MEARAGTDIRKEARNDRIEFKLKLREKMLTEKLKRRIVPPSPQTAQTSLSKASSDAEVKEEPNLNKEAPEETKGKLDLNICRKKNKISKKKCWVCASPYHFKKNCPYIDCFYCNQPGHTKKYCYKRKTDYIFNWLWEMFIKQKESYEKRWKRKIEICKKFQESSYKKIGETWKVFWKGKEVGEYTGPGTPKHFRAYNETLPNSINKRFIESETKKATPIEKLKLFHGFTNWCACGKTDLTKSKFIKHVRDIHDGIVLPNCYLNRPPWIDRIFFYSDEAEIFYNDIKPDWEDKD